MEVDPAFKNTLRWSFPFWIAVAVALIIVFNFAGSSSVMGIPLPDVIAAGFVFAVVIALKAYSWWWKRNSGAKRS
jgi:protein-S-isoprenylcysteine O-methyltransferase Ste14